MGEIALAILREKSKGDRFPDLNNIKRNLGNASKELDFPAEELLRFWVCLYSNLFFKLLAEAENISFAPKEPPKTRTLGEKIQGFVGFKNKKV